MFFSVGIESPKNASTAFGIIVPAFDQFNYGCVSAADEQADIPVMAREAILSIVEEMIISGTHSVEDITDAGFMVYAANPEYAHCDTWFMIDVDLSEFEGKQQRVNITLPDVLIKRIDGFIQGKRPVYKDRSHFLAQAARRELSNK
ncbi:type II toxin-antitoxin system HicB family antitoxin [Salmonella enterica]|nr:CopG family transcriptional regulator [Salmonella enterica subsp. enterica serovar Glostrup]